MARACIFCGGRADSKEDAWPCWLTERFIAPGTLEFQPGIDAPLMTRPLERPEVRIGWFCEKCNTGWMSQLEKRAKPVITCLLDHPTCTLDVHDRKTLALWAVKTAMVLEAVKGPEQCLFSDLERCLLSHKRDQIPPFTFVWIAKLIDSAGLSSEGRILSTATTSNRAAVTTLAFDCLTFQVRKVVPSTTLDPATNITIEQREGPWDQVLLQIWPQPPELVHWPAPMGLHGEWGA
jgi:hypothetical protein